MLCTLQVWHSISESVLFLREQEQEKCQGIRSIANKLVTESLGVWSRFYPTSIFEASRNITIIDEKFSVLDPLTSFKPEILIKGAGWKRSEKRWYRILLLLFFFFFFFFLLAFIIIDPLHSSSHFVLVYISVLWITGLFFLTNNSSKKIFRSEPPRFFIKYSVFY